MPFTPSSSEPLADAVLALGHAYGNNTPVSLYLESDNGGMPGNILATLTQQGDIQSIWDGGGSLIEFDCSGCGTVNAGTQYWLVAVEGDPNSAQAWMWAYQDRTGLGAFNDLGSATGPWTLYEDDILSGFRVDGAVPEPGSLVMLGSGILAAVAAIRRKL